MITSELVSRARTAGLELIDRGEKLKVRGPHPLPVHLLNDIRERKGDILEYLRSQSDPLPSVKETFGVAELGRLSLDSFADSGRVIRVRSEVLDEKVLFAGDRATVDPVEPLPIYRGSELCLLVSLSLSPTDLRRLHEAKKTLGLTYGIE